MVKIGGWSYRSPSRVLGKRGRDQVVSRRPESLHRSRTRVLGKRGRDVSRRVPLDSLPLHRSRLERDRLRKRRRRIVGGCGSGCGGKRKKKQKGGGGGGGGLIGSARALGYQTSTSVSNLARMFSGKAAVTSPLPFVPTRR